MTVASSAPGRSLLGWARSSRIELLLALLVLVGVGPLMHHFGEQQASRYALTAAIWDDHSIVIDDYSDLLGRDRVIRDGRTYSDKAPGQPLFAVPSYAAYRALGGPPATEATATGDWGLWAVTFWSATFPGAALIALLYREAKEAAPDKPTRVALAVFFGTLLVTYSVLLFGHVLAALCGFAAYRLIRASDGRGRLAASGALLGLAVATEYTMVIVLLAVVVYAVVLHRTRALWVVAGGLPFAGLLAWYHTVAFGGPLTTSYQWSAFLEVVDEARSPLAMFSPPSGENTLQVLIGERGLLLASPIVVIAIVGLVVMIRQQSTRAQGVLVSSVVLGFLLIPVFWGNAYAGGAGPRYIVPALPFLVWPIAIAWRRLPVLASGTAVIGGVTMLAATLTEPQLASTFDAGLDYWGRLVWSGDFTNSAAVEVFGEQGWILHLGAVGVPLVALVVSSRRLETTK